MEAWIMRGIIGFVISILLYYVKKVDKMQQEVVIIEAKLWEEEKLKDLVSSIVNGVMLKLYQNGTITASGNEK